MYVGAIYYDVELTRVCGPIQMLDGKISVMADCGFTIRDQLSRINVGLNILPFMEEHIYRARKFREDERLLHYAYMWKGVYKLFNIERHCTPHSK